MSGPEWEYAGSVYLPKWHYTAYRDDSLGVEMRVYTRRTWSHFLRNHKRFYFIDGIPRVYKTQEELFTALARQEPKELYPPTHHARIKGKNAFAH
jgi:hypothetical protein